MKRASASSAQSIPALISLILLYFFLLGGVLFFSRQFLLNLVTASPSSYTPWISAFLLLHLGLFGFLLLQIIRLFRERARRRAGARLKARMVLFFLLISLLSSLPQGILSFNFINIAITNWFSQDLNQTMEGGVQIALEYYHDKNNNLKTFGESSLFALMLQRADENPENLWKNIREANPEISSIQAFSQNGREILFYGKRSGRLTPQHPQEKQSGFLPKESRDGKSVLRYQRSFQYQDSPAWAVLSIILPEGFDAKARRLTAASQTYHELNSFSSLFQGALLLLFLLFSIPLLLLSVLTAFFLSNEIIRPIVQLEKAARRVSEGDFTPRILTRTNDELASLAQTFNTMIAELQNSRARIMQSEKITTWQEIAQQLAHEIRNPLTPIKLSAERVLHKQKNHPEDLPALITPAMNSIITEVEGLNHMLQEFRNFARMPEARKEPVQLREVLQKSLEPFQYSYPSVQISWEVTPRELTLTIDKQQFQQIFTNLIKNALEAMEPLGTAETQGTLEIETNLVKKGGTRYCRISFRDNGPGIAEKDHASIFNPYFTTKKTGSGLGLSIVERILFDHGGTIWFETAQGKESGTTFFVDIPLPETASEER